MVYGDHRLAPSDVCLALDADRMYRVLKFAQLVDSAWQATIIACPMSNPLLHHARDVKQAPQFELRIDQLSQRDDQNEEHGDPFILHAALIALQPIHNALHVKILSMRAAKNDSGRLKCDRT
jgi:hypothetical protein